MAILNSLRALGVKGGKFSGYKRIVIDGPFAKTRELLAGYHLVECRDLDEVLSTAARIPTLPAGGAIEVRPFESTHENEFLASG